MHTFFLKLIFPSVFMTFLFSAQSEQPPLRVLRHVAMATEFEAILYGETCDTDPESLLSAGRAAFDAVDALENRISSWKSDSYTSLVNRRASQSPVEVSVDLLEILEDAKKIHVDTGGTFDVTVGPLIQFWKSREKLGIFPNHEEVKPVLQTVGLKQVLVDKQAHTIQFKRPGMNLDFGGIAKGLAVDRMANILIENGVKTARLNAGTSTILALGAPPEDSGWTVDILSPYNDGQGEPVATVKICNEALSTSANTIRYLRIDGKCYSHIFNPHTGMPVTGISSATAIAPTGVESDALSTAFFVMGVEKVRAYCSAHPSVRAILLKDLDESSEPIFINFSPELNKE